jgi:Flp pilus assembly protein TadB
MSRARAQRRAEQDAARARAQAAAAERERREASRAARRRALRGSLPQRVRVARPRGVLESRRRQRRALVALGVVLVQVASFLLLDSWYLRLAVLGLSLLFAPVLLVLLDDRRS